MLHSFRFPYRFSRRFALLLIPLLLALALPLCVLILPAALLAHMPLMPPTTAQAQPDVAAAPTAKPGFPIALPGSLVIPNPGVY
jgi:hypothetical protein